MSADANCGSGGGAVLAPASPRAKSLPAVSISIFGNFSLTPGFSPVFGAHGDSAALAAFRRSAIEKTVKTVFRHHPLTTRLKPGANESGLLAQKLRCSPPGAAASFLLAFAGALALNSGLRAVRKGLMIIYAICLVVGLLFTLISAVAGHLFGGGDHDMDVGTGGHAEAGFDHSGVPGLSFFSPTVIASFVTAFGAFGLIFSRIGVTSSPWASAPLSLAGGGLVAAAVLWLFNSMFRKTQSSSESRVATLVGATASIVTPIPENGVGEIAYVQGGSRYTAPARSENGTPVAAGRAVRITRIVGAQFYVEATK